MLAMLPISSIVPVIDIGMGAGYFQYTAIPEIFDEYGFVGNNVQQAVEPAVSGLSLPKLLVLLYGTGVFIRIIKFFFALYKIARIRQYSEPCSDNGFRFYLSDSPVVFSFFRWIFIPRNQHKETDCSIIEHERLHGKSWHTLDLLLTEMFIALLWFNPFVYLFRRDLKTVHEYQVDTAILDSEIKKSDYLQLMLCNLVSEHRLGSLCNYFNGFTIKKRVKMITRDKSPKWKLMSYTLIIPVIAIMIMSFSQSPVGDGDTPSILPIKAGEEYKITSTFGMRMHPILKEERFHNGIDFAAKEGTQIVATADGVVATAEFREGSYGKMITINHGGGFETWYTQMSDFEVAAGDKVKRGKVIGYVGSSGVSTGPHLHYEVRLDGKPVDPGEYIKE